MPGISRGPHCGQPAPGLITPWLANPCNQLMSPHTRYTQPPDKLTQRFQSACFGRKPNVFGNHFRPPIFSQYSPVFCNFPLAKEDNVFPASLVFLTRSFPVFLWYLGLLLPLGHPSMSTRFFFGHGNVPDCLDFVRGLCLFVVWFCP